MTISPGQDLIVLDFGPTSIFIASIDTSSTRQRIKSFADVRNETLPKALEEVLSGMGVSKKTSAVALWSDGVSFRWITIPDMPEKEIQRAIAWELETKHSFRRDEQWFAYEALGQTETPEGREKHYSVFFCDKEPIRARLEAAEAAGVKIASVFPGETAVAAFASGLSGGGETLVCDIGRNTAKMLVIRNKKILLHRQLPLGGQVLTEMMTGPYEEGGQARRLTAEEAEALKVREGAGNPQAPYIGLVRPYLDKLLAEIKRSIEYHESQPSGAAVTGVVFSGGGSMLKGLAEFMAQFLSVKVHVAAAADYGADGQAAENKFGSLHASLGAAAVSRGFDLMPHERVPSKKFSGIPSTKKILIGLAALAALVLGAKAAHLGWLDRSMGAAKQEWGSLSSYYDIFSDVQRQRRFEQVAMRNALSQASTLKALSRLTPPPVTLGEVFYDRAAGTVILKGSLRASAQADVKVLAQYAQDLAHSSFFREASILNTNRGDEGSSFEIRCVVKENVS